MPSQLLCTVADDRFALGCRVMLHSLRRHLRGFDGADVKVLYDARIAALSEENQAAIARVAPGVVFEAVGSATYRQAKSRYEHHRPALLTLEAFRQYDYERVLFFDSDMLCVADFSDAMEMLDEYDLTACEAGRVFDAGRWAEREGPVRGRWGRRKYFGLVGRRAHKVNTGLLAIGRRLRTPTIYERLLDTVRRRRIRTSKALLLDQWAINEALGTLPTSLYLLPNGYNLRALDRYASDHREATRVLHYSGYHQRPKPWEADAPRAHPAYAAWTRYAAELDAVERSKQVA